MWNSKAHTYTYAHSINCKKASHKTEITDVEKLQHAPYSVKREDYYYFSVVTVQKLYHPLFNISEFAVHSVVYFGVQAIIFLTWARKMKETVEKTENKERHFSLFCFK